MKYFFTLFLAGICFFVSAQSIDSLEARMTHTSGPERVDLLLQMAQFYDFKDWEQSVAYAVQGLALAREYENDTLLFKTHYQLSNSYLGLGNYDSALVLGKSTLAKAYDDDSRGMAYHYLGYIYERLSQYEQSLKFYLQAVEMKKSLNNTQSLANTLNAISFVYKGMNQHEKAIDVLKEAGDIYAKEGNIQGQARVTFNMGLMIMEMDRHVESIPYFRRAIRIGKITEENNPYVFSLFCNNMANCYSHMVEANASYYDSALYYGEKNFHLKKQLNDHLGVANAHNILAGIYNSIDDFEKSYLHALEALKLSDSLDFKKIKANALRYLVNAGTGMAGQKELNDYFARYIEVTEELDHEAQSEILNDMAVKYETEKKEAENANLKKANQQQARLNRILGVGGGLLGVFLVALGYLYTKQSKQNKTIESQSQELQKLNDLKSRFFANISHELRTPLTLARGNVDLLLDTPGDKTQRHKLNNTRRSLDQLSGMVEDLLDLSKFELGLQQLRKAPVRLSTFLSRVVGSFQSLAESQQIALVFDDRTVVPVFSSLDVRQFEKVVNNLLYNAFKFTGTGGTVTLTLNLADSHAVISVKDTGIGIDEHNLPHIFDRFYQAESPSQQGSGLGLSIAKEIVELHGGEIWVSSQPGEGTEFALRIALANDGQAGEGDQEWSIDVPYEDFLKESLLKWEVKKPAILLVEDNVQMRDYLREVLEPVFKLKAASEGTEALQLLPSVKPSLIISDVMMPGMDGIEFLKQLKKNPIYATVPFILLTAKASSEDKLLGLRLGVDDYMTKPFDREELLIRVVNLLDNLEQRLKWENESQNDPDDEEPHITIAEEQLVNRIRDYIETHISDSKLSVAEIAGEVSMSDRQLLRKTTEWCGMTPAQLIMEVRLQYARRRLVSGEIVKLSQLALEVGIGTPAYLSKMFFKRFGKRATDYIS